MATTTNARALAVQQLNSNPAATIGVWVDSDSKPGFVAIGLAFRSGAQVLIEVEAKEYTGLRLLEMIDADPRAPRPGPRQFGDRRGH